MLGGFGFGSLGANTSCLMMLDAHDARGVWVQHARGLGSEGPDHHQLMLMMLGGLRPSTS